MSIRSGKIVGKGDLEAVREDAQQSLYPQTTKIAVGMASCGLAAGAGKVFDGLNALLADDPEVVVTPTGCLGFCQMEPMVSVHRPGQPRIVYSQVLPKALEQFVAGAVRGEQPAEQSLCRMDEEELIIAGESKRLATGEVAEQIAAIPAYGEIPFYRNQVKIVLRNCGLIDSDRIDEYIGRGGYFSAWDALSSKTPEDVIAEVKGSGLRGRGGAGFPTGLKWEFCRKATGDSKVVICNADEGDPGAYMDRSVLEGDPHSVLEGMLLGAYAIGAERGVIYVRSEYPLAVRKLTRAIEQARECGLLGDRIFGTDFCFDVEIFEGAGAFVCGEETSLIASIEGRPAEPRPRPPFPAQSGLWQAPTNINNVETWANIPVILARGGEWYSQIGTEDSKGTKVFSLVGKVVNTGLVEVPMGIQLDEIVNSIGGGILKGKRLKAIQTGGPSGGCVPEALAKMPVDYQHLASVGSIMGSGGMVVMDEDTCMVDIARYFTHFTRDESCGKCLSCRDGLDQALRLLTRMTEGKAGMEDLGALEDLCEAIRAASQCALGQTAPNPVLSTIRHFRDEYVAHVADGRCPAGVCKAFIVYRIDEEKCTGCTKCARTCPHGAVEGERKEPHTILADKCVKCGLCYDECPFDAIVRGQVND